MGKEQSFDTLQIAKRDMLLSRLVHPDFIRGEGQIISTHLQMLIQEEVILAQTSPIYTFPLETVSVIYPEGLLFAHEQKLLTQKFLEQQCMSQSHIEIAMTRQDQPSAGLIFSSTPNDLRGNKWECKDIRLGTGSPNIIIAYDGNIARIEKNKISRIKEGDLDSLHQLVENPTLIVEDLPKEKMLILPDRPMTVQEHREWLRIAKNIEQNPVIKQLEFSTSKTIYSNRYIPSNNTFLLKATGLNQENNLVYESVFIPFEIQENGQTIGWDIAAISKGSDGSRILSIQSGLREMAALKAA